MGKLISRSTKLRVRKTLDSTQRVITIICLIVFVGLFIIAQNNLIIPKQYIFQSDKIPKVFVGYKILHISDIVNSPGMVLNTANMAEPDLVIISGNLSDSNGNFENSVKLIEKLSSKVTTLYTLGEYDQNAKDSIQSEITNKTSAIFIEDMALDIEAPTVNADEFISEFIGGKFIRLAESGDTDAKSYIDYTKASLNESADSKIVITGLPVMESSTDFIDKTYSVANLDRSLFQVLVLNQTQYAQSISKTDMDVILSGNTFGTDSLQVGLSKGNYSLNGATVFVSGGIGKNPETNGRIFNFPEVSIITLSDGTIKDENPLEKLLGYFIDDVKTRFDGDNGFTVYRKDY